MPPLECEGESGGLCRMGAQAMGSIYKLTLSEVADHLGEPLLSMNLDDLLRNVGEPPSGPDLGVDPEPAGSSQRKPGVPLNRVLSRKTVDEVWRDIQQHHPAVGDETGSLGDRRPTLGEMTLEDFLLKVGVVAEGWDGDPDAGESIVGTDGGQWLQHQYQQATSVAASLPRQPIVLGGGYGLAHPMPLPLQSIQASAPIADVCYSDQMGISSNMPDSPVAGRKRVGLPHGDFVEKTVERRQKRMIKNRESAARSRARKQAYTNELENKVSRLEEENELLKKQQEIDRILYSIPIPEPKFRLRRTCSALI